MEEEPEVVAEVTEQFLQTATPGDGFVEIQTVDFDVVPGEAQIIGQIIESNEAAAQNKLVLIQDSWTSGVLIQLHNMCQNGLFCDMALVSSESEKLLCHTPVMVAASGYISKLMTALQQNLSNSQLSIHLTLKAHNINQILNFIYTGRVVVAATELDCLEQAATILDIPVLKGLCRDALVSFQKSSNTFQSDIAVEPSSELPVDDDNISASAHLEPQGIQLALDGDIESDVESEITNHIIKKEAGVPEANDVQGTVLINIDNVQLSEDNNEGNLLIQEENNAATATLLLGTDENPTSSPAEDINSTSTWERSFACGLCERTFHRKDLLIAHQRVHSGDRPYKCTYCPKAFKQRPHLIEHVRQHTGEKPYHCKDCDRDFAYYSHYQKHRKIHAEGGRQQYVCKFCSKAFLTYRVFKGHVEEHTGDRPYVCSACDEGFTRKDRCTEHEQVVHGLHNALKCNGCDKMFANQSHLTEHERTHTGERPFVCGTCNKGFKTKSTLLKHLGTHIDGSQRPFSCGEKDCRKTYLREKQLIEHQRTHSGEKPYKCDSCGISFARQSSLYNHNKIHSTDQQFQCAVCAASFLRKDDCIRHMTRRHPDGRRYQHQCCIGKCVKQFPTANKLKRHQRRIHGKVDKSEPHLSGVDSDGDDDELKVTEDHIKVTTINLERVKKEPKEKESRGQQVAVETCKQEFITVHINEDLDMEVTEMNEEHFDDNHSNSTISNLLD